MLIEEFSNSFDTLLNSYNIQAGFGEGSSKQQGAGITLDEYEKSSFLTQAQDIVVKSYFDRTLNNQGQGFDDTPRRQVDFSSLIKIKRYSSSDDKISQKGDLYDDRGYNVTLEKNILFVLNEKLEIGSGKDKKIYVVVPINYREYDREMSKAYAQPLKKQAWRLFSNAGTGYDIKSEIIPIYGTTEAKTETTSYVHIARSGDDNDITYEWEDSSALDNYTLKGTVRSKEELPEATEALYNENAAYELIQENVSTAAMSYVIRYVERPNPIILRPLPNGLTIDGYTGNETKSLDGSVTDSNIFTGEGINCSLNPVLHMDILNKAFELAVTTRGGGTAQLSSRTSERQQQ